MNRTYHFGLFRDHVGGVRLGVTRFRPRRQPLPPAPTIAQHVIASQQRWCDTRSSALNLWIWFMQRLWMWL